MEKPETDDVNSILNFDLAVLYEHKILIYDGYVFKIELAANNNLSTRYSIPTEEKDDGTGCAKTKKSYTKIDKIIDENDTSVLVSEEVSDYNLKTYTNILYELFLRGFWFQHFQTFQERFNMNRLYSITLPLNLFIF